MEKPADRLKEYKSILPNDSSKNGHKRSLFNKIVQKFWVQSLFIIFFVTVYLIYQKDNETSAYIDNNHDENDSNQGIPIQYDSFALDCINYDVTDAFEGEKNGIIKIKIDCGAKPYYYQIDSSERIKLEHLRNNIYIITNLEININGYTIILFDKTGISVNLGSIPINKRPHKIINELNINEIQQKIDSLRNSEIEWKKEYTKAKFIENFIDDYFISKKAKVSFTKQKSGFKGNEIYSYLLHLSMYLDKNFRVNVNKIDTTGNNLNRIGSIIFEEK